MVKCEPWQVLNFSKLWACGGNKELVQLQLPLSVWIKPEITIIVLQIILFIRSKGDSKESRLTSLKIKLLTKQTRQNYSPFIGSGLNQTRSTSAGPSPVSRISCSMSEFIGSPAPAIKFLFKHWLLFKFALSRAVKNVTLIFWSSNFNSGWGLDI